MLSVSEACSPGIVNKACLDGLRISTFPSPVVMDIHPTTGFEDINDVAARSTCTRRPLFSEICTKRPAGATVNCGESVSTPLRTTALMFTRYHPSPCTGTSPFALSNDGLCGAGLVVLLGFGAGSNQCPMMAAAPSCSLVSAVSCLPDMPANLYLSWESPSSLANCSFTVPEGSMRGPTAALVESPTTTSTIATTAENAARTIASREINVTEGILKPGKGPSGHFVGEANSLFIM
mmetsp:Transcript_35024/g.111419  ORF Transcript_35024/g.111419 Transcript_35024/m.111419 type:complete len:235 (-) Transcript_35024:206-910(-)